jgi:tRNA threonylcarbamoyladenosine biosynthesis protein TsaE
VKGSERTKTAAETEALGARLAEELGPGDVVLVSGGVGTGKTTLIRGACAALGVTDRVTSPTFVIGHRYRGRLPVAHLDLYRLEDLDGEEPALLDDYLTVDAVSFIEWPAALERSPLGPAHLARVVARVELRHGGGDEREISVSR